MITPCLVAGGNAWHLHEVLAFAARNLARFCRRGLHCSIHRCLCLFSLLSVNVVLLSLKFNRLSIWGRVDGILSFGFERHYLILLYCCHPGTTADLTFISSDDDGGLALPSHAVPCHLQYKLVCLGGSRQDFQKKSFVDSLASLDVLMGRKGRNERGRLRPTDFKSVLLADLSW